MNDNSRSEQEHNTPDFEVDEEQQSKNQILRIRINELAKKAKTEAGLTSQEEKEQTELRAEFLENFRKAFRSQIEMTQIFDEEGNEVTPKKVIDIQKEKGLRD